jgi:hypothetical protein
MMHGLVEIDKMYYVSLWSKQFWLVVVVSSMHLAVNAIKKSDIY